MVGRKVQRCATSIFAGRSKVLKWVQCVVMLSALFWVLFGVRVLAIIRIAYVWVIAYSVVHRVGDKFIALNCYAHNE